MHIFFLGVNPATNDRMILYYCLMTKVDWLGDSTVFSWAGCQKNAHMYSSLVTLFFALRAKGFY
jgi:hypothetical protein